MCHLLLRSPHNQFLNKCLPLDNLTPTNMRPLSGEALTFNSVTFSRLNRAILLTNLPIRQF